MRQQNRVQFDTVIKKLGTNRDFYHQNSPDGNGRKRENMNADDHRMSIIQ